MRRRDILLTALALVAVAGWFAVRSPDGGAEKKGMLKERLRAAESAMQTLDAQRAPAREALRLAEKKADENRALSKRAAAALPPYERRRKEAEINLANVKRNQRRADGTEQPAADDAAMLRRLNALLR